MRRSRLVVLMVAVCFSSGVLCAGGDAPAARPRGSGDGKTGPGTTPAEAIEVCTPKGEIGYLSRLRCPNGRAPRFERGGSVGPRNEPQSEEDEQAMMEQLGTEPKPGQKDFHIIDVYEVKCSTKTYAIHLDMYHCKSPEPMVAPPGFTLAKAAGDPGR